MNVLDGFEERSVDGVKSGSKQLIEAFIMRRVPCMGKRYEDKAELKKDGNRLVSFLRNSEYGDIVRISIAGGMLSLIRKDMEDEHEK